MKRNKRMLGIHLLGMLMGLVLMITMCMPAYAAKKTEEKKIVVAQPTKLKLTTIGYKSVNVKWNKVSGATGYVVYCYNGKTKKYDLAVAKTKAGVTAAKVTGLKKGGFYGFSVKAYKTVNKKNHWSKYSNVVKCVTRQSKTTGVKVYETGTNYAKLSWNTTEGARGYRVYKYNATTKKYTKVSDVKTTYAKVTSLKPGTMYSFVVRSYRKEKDYIGFGHNSSMVKTYIEPSAVTTIRQSGDGLSNSSIKIKWNAATGADGYYVYRYDTNNSKWKLLKTVGASTKTYTDKGLSSGTEYKYAVRSYSKFGSVIVRASKYYTRYGITTPKIAGEVTTSSVTSKECKLTWKKATGANGYYIYKYNEITGTYEVIAKTTKTSYVVSGLESYTSYIFKVYPFKTYRYDEKNYKGAALTRSMRTELGSPETIKVSEKTDSSISYKWDGVKNASGYKINLYNGNSSSGSPFKTITVASSVTNYTYSQGYAGIINITIEVIPYVRKTTINTGGTEYNYSEGTKLTTSNALDSVTGLDRDCYGTDYLGIKWTAVDRAMFYEVYQKKGDEEDYKLVATTDKLKVKFTELTPGTTYKYKVRAVMTSGSVEFRGDYSEEFELITKHEAPNVTIDEACFKYVRLAWNKMSNITGYKIYKLDTKTGEYVLNKTIKDPNTLTYTDKDVSSGKSFKYKVRGYKNIGSLGYYGTQCEEVEAKIGVYGIDISKYQNNIDWKKVKASGVDFAIIRATTKTYSSISSNGTKLSKDTNFDKNMSEAIAAGIKVGVYVYSYADSVAEAAAEARLAISLVKDYKMSYPIYFDIEEGDRNKSSLKTANTNMAVAFCEEVEDAGYKAGVYSGAAFMVNALDMKKLSVYDVWVARYLYSDKKFYFPSGMTDINKTIKMSYTYNGKYTSITADMWQYTSQGRIDGISGNVDMNYGYTSY